MNLEYYLLATKYADVTAVQFAAVFVVIVALMGALKLGTDLKNLWFPAKKSATDFKLNPSPLPVEVTKTMASKDELREFEADVCKRFEQIERQINEERKAARVALGKVHARIDKVMEATAEIKGEVRQIGSNVEKLLSNHLQ